MFQICVDHRGVSALRNAHGLEVHSRQKGRQKIEAREILGTVSLVVVARVTERGKPGRLDGRLEAVTVIAAWIELFSEDV